jgi:hypothetical protein
MAVDWIKFRGEKVLFVDYANFKANEVLPQMRKAAELCNNSSFKVLLLANFENVDLGKVSERNEILQEAYQLGLKVFNEKTKKSAIIGMSGIKKMFYNLYVRFSKHEIKLFDTKESALAYLVPETSSKPFEGRRMAEST